MATQKEKIKAEEKKEERIKTRREKLGNYFLNMSQLSFAGMVVGGLTPLFNNTATENPVWGGITIFLGIVFTVTFALIGNKILK